MGYVVGLPAYVLIKVLAPGYFARKDTRTPVRIAIVAMAVNLVLNLALIWPLQHVGLALATALAAWLNAALLAGGLLRRGHLILDARLRGRLVRIAGITVLMTAVLWVARDALAAISWIDSRSARTAALAGLVVLGMVVYGAAAQISGAMQIAEWRTLLRRRGTSA
jgi:putative peptidoglycan lipid II flippase